MIQSNNSPPSILTSAVLAMALGVALEGQPVIAAPPHAAETSAQAASARGERHRHGPSGKGFYHTQRHEKPTSIDRRHVSPRRYGPPSKGFRIWTQDTRVRRPVLEDAADETRSREKEGCTMTGVTADDDKRRVVSVIRWPLLMQRARAQESV